MTFEPFLIFANIIFRCWSVHFLAELAIVDRVRAEVISTHIEEDANIAQNETQEGIEDDRALEGGHELEVRVVLLPDAFHELVLHIRVRRQYLTIQRPLPVEYDSRLPFE